MSDTQTLLRDVQNRQKVLLGKKDQLIREAGIEEQKLSDALNKLREYGVADPEDMSADEMQAKATELEQSLATKLVEITEEISKGEALLREYDGV